MFRIPGVIPEINRRLDEWAEEHAEKSNGRLRAISPESEYYPNRMRSHVKGNRKSIGEIALIATAAEPTFPQLREQAASLDADELHELSRMHGNLAAGHNYAQVYPHFDLIDIPLGQAAIHQTLADPEQHGPYPAQNAIAINTMIERLEVNIDGAYAPAMSALATLEDNTFLSYPRTDSGMRHLRDDQLSPLEIGVRTTISDHNRRFRHRISNQLDKGSTNLALAPSGTVAKPSGPGSDTLIIPGVNKATAEILCHEHTFVMAVAISFGNGQRPHLRVVDKARMLRSYADVQGLMHDLAAAQTDITEGKTYVYDELGEAA